MASNVLPLIVKCPHCELFVEIEQLNCRIFRHGTFKHDGKQINPHLPKQECERLYKNNLIYGCGKPFQIPHGKQEAIICDYI